MKHSSWSKKPLGCLCKSCYKLNLKGQLNEHHNQNYDKGKYRRLCRTLYVRIQFTAMERFVVRKNCYAPYLGKAAYIDDAPVGIIMGQSEQGDASVQFHLLEFCVKTTAQNKGIGTSLMNELTAELKSQGIKHIYLITSHGEKTEGFYSRRGFRMVSEIVMVNDID